MAKRERVQSNTIAGQISAFEAVRHTVAPPIPLSASEMTYFQGIVIDREASSWSPNHLLIACNLAKTYAAIDDLWRDIRDQGYTIVNERGTPVANPSVSALSNMTNAMQALNRTLGLSASQRGLSGEKQAARNRVEKGINERNAEADSHSLLA